MAPSQPVTRLKPAAAPYWLYLLECQGGSYYTGIALDVEQRFFLHVFGRGARYTRTHPPLRVLALRAEYRLKQLSRGEKLVFLTASCHSSHGQQGSTYTASNARICNHKSPDPEVTDWINDSPAAYWRRHHRNPAFAIRDKFAVVNHAPPTIKGKTCSDVLHTPSDATAGGGSGDMRIQTLMISARFHTLPTQ